MDDANKNYYDALVARIQEVLKLQKELLDDINRTSVTPGTRAVRFGIRDVSKASDAIVQAYIERSILNEGILAYAFSVEPAVIRDIKQEYLKTKLPDKEQ